MEKESEEIKKNKDYEQRESLALDWHQDIVFKKIHDLVTGRLSYETDYTKGSKQPCGSQYSLSFPLPSL